MVIMGKYPEFERGDRVKAMYVRGPTMVVEEVYQPFFNFRYRCRWTNEDGVEQVANFRVEDLMSADWPPPRTDLPRQTGRPSPF
ncbi:MAG: hypothetical protein JWO38_7087 [Gemmataceae bacterium]|nr:hypothetical protein [Gemmataceae bacterium]